LFNPSWRAPAGWYIRAYWQAIRGSSERRTRRRSPSENETILQPFLSLISAASQAPSMGPTQASEGTQLIDEVQSFIPPPAPKPGTSTLVPSSIESSALFEMEEDFGMQRLALSEGPPQEMSQVLGKTSLFLWVTILCPHLGSFRDSVDESRTSPGIQHGVLHHRVECRSKQRGGTPRC
jgi:hypothetical protein